MKKPSFFDKGLKLGSWLVIPTILWGLSYIVVYWLLGASPLANHVTVFYGVVLSLVMTTALISQRNKPTFGIIAFFSLLSLLYFFPRIFQYLAVKPEHLKLLYVLFPYKWSPAEINYGLLYVVLGAVAIILGVVFGNKVYQKLRKSEVSTNPLNPKNKELRIIPLILAGMVVFGVECYFTLYLGASAASNCTENVPAGIWLLHFFSGDVFYLVAVVFLAEQIRRLKKSYVLFYLLTTFGYLFYMLLHGSRGGILRVMVLTFATAVVFGKNFKIKFWQVAVFVPLIGASSMVMYLSGTSIREFHRINCKDGILTKIELDKIEEKYEEQNEGYTASEKFTGHFREEKNNLNRIKIPAKYARIFDRLGQLDYPIGIAAIEGDKEAINKYMSMEHVLKNIANNLVIGVPYPEAMEMTNNMMPIIYRGHDIQHVKSNFVSEPWTLWGLGFIYFGYFGGLIFIFLSAALLQAGYMVVSSLKFTHSSLVRVFYFWVVTATVLFSMGFDHSLIVWMYGAAQMVTTILVIRLFGYIQEKFFLKKQNI